MKSGNLNFLETSGPLQVCNGTVLPYPILWEAASVPVSPGVAEKRRAVAHVGNQSTVRHGRCLVTIAAALPQLPVFVILTLNSTCVFSAVFSNFLLCEVLNSEMVLEHT